MNFLASPFIALAAVHLISVASPGPDFALISRLALTKSRKSALLATIGLVLSNAVHLLWMFFGLAKLAAVAPSFLTTVRVFGALYLGYLGVKALVACLQGRRPVKDLDGVGESKTTVVQDIGTGLLTNLLNPKAIVYFMSLGAQFITPGLSTSTVLIYAAETLLIAWLWFSSLSLLFGMSSLQTHMIKFTPAINGLTGVIFLGFAAKILELL